MVIGTECEVCPTQFWSRHKLLEHLQDRAPVCRAALSAARPRIELEEVQRIDAEARVEAMTERRVGARRARTIRPAVRVIGPMVQLPIEEPSGAHRPLGVGRRWLRLPEASSLNGEASFEPWPPR